MKFYLCNGYNTACGYKSNEKGMCRPENCYLSGGDCKHTTDSAFAKNSTEDMEFEKKENGDLWEKS